MKRYLYMLGARVLNKQGEPCQYVNMNVISPNVDGAIAAWKRAYPSVEVETVDRNSNAIGAFVDKAGTVVLVAEAIAPIAKKRKAE